MNIKQNEKFRNKCSSFKKEQERNYLSKKQKVICSRSSMNIKQNRPSSENRSSGFKKEQQINNLAKKPQEGSKQDLHFPPLL
jgi:hypothetical protein